MTQVKIVVDRWMRPIVMLVAVALDSLLLS